MTLLFKREVMIDHLTERINTYTAYAATLQERINNASWWSGSDPNGDSLSRDVAIRKIGFFQFVLDHLRPEGDIAISIQDIGPLELYV